MFKIDKNRRFLCLKSTKIDDFYVQNQQKLVLFRMFKIDKTDASDV